MTKYNGHYYHGHYRGHDVFAKLIDLIIYDDFKNFIKKIFKRNQMRYIHINVCIYDDEISIRIYCIPVDIERYVVFSGDINNIFLDMLVELKK